MISNFIRCIMFFTKSTNFILFIIFLIFLGYNDIFLSILKVESHFIFQVYNLIYKPLYIIIS